ncbi:GNAT family N-acetyltransferase [Tsukamurella ocularis]|uniref:GNAT family N-acetyltransferase n=1 Tax=Tsukamurella ocularis TaxID=1970234 RepID=UPI00216A87E6|nr:GNAT family N-acetyltransferase [Tsukamurella ocularis]MCS3781229.1 RimJ/RimL family protein N-acetyltransferase [Tsukamurella ocularis]MCS3787600.1 RimJ/RimL family protein N-acetyltransferase [Tsukamurella ocularis]MCS3850895.1 RimJ/RimL family protein N-acetyltransferase [Tsukamurella ocularis]
MGWFSPDDFAAVHAFASDLRVCEFMTWGPNSPVDTHRFLMERMTPSANAYHLAVIVRGEVVGSAAVWETDSANMIGEMGYSLAPHVWGNGYATEAARMLIDIGRERLGLVRIAATCDVDNAASARVLEKIGMAREGTLRSLKVVRGERRDHHLYAVITPQ